MNVALTRDLMGRITGNPSILLASDKQRESSLQRVLREEGFEVAFAGDYAGISRMLDGQDFDVVLLEVSGEDAVEDAVAAALWVKRARAGQFVGYVADSSLLTSGLAGDGVFPRSNTGLPAALRRFFADGEPGSSAPARREPQG
jgi:hypothetical protein